MKSRAAIAAVAVLVLLAAWQGTTAAEPDQGLDRAEVERLTAVIREVKPMGAGHRQAREAWQKLAQAPAEQLPAILSGMDGAGPLAVNWIRAAVDAVAERSVQRGAGLPVEPLEQFLSDRKHNPRARRVAYEWISKVDPTAPDRLVPGFLDDPSLELRRDAVARLLAKADALATAGNSDDALATYQAALAPARDPDQVRQASAALAKLGHTVDLARHFGFITQWKLIGPFDNSGKKGFAVAYPPERDMEPTGSYDGKIGKVSWQSHASKKEDGQIDLNEAVGTHKGAVAYAIADFTSAAAQPVELRWGTPNATRIWLNGQLLGEAEVYHANSSIDQYVARGRLRKGKNTILVKVCQNEQTEEWAVAWRFQLRACDATGTAILPVEAGGQPVGPAATNRQLNPLKGVSAQAASNISADAGGASR